MPNHIENNIIQNKTGRISGLAVSMKNVEEIKIITYKAKAA
jgi:hypothetical protein